MFYKRNKYFFLIAAALFMFVSQISGALPAAAAQAAYNGLANDADYGDWEYKYQAFGQEAGAVRHNPVIFYANGNSTYWLNGKDWNTDVLKRDRGAFTFMLGGGSITGKTTVCYGKISYEGGYLYGPHDDTTFHTKSGGVIELCNVTAVAGEQGSLINVNGDGKLLANSSILSGDVKDINGKLFLGLKNNSSLTGAFMDGNRGRSDFYIDSSSRWNVTGDSEVRGVLRNHGTIDFTLSEMGTTLFVQNYLSAPGEEALLVLKTDLIGENNDQLVIGSTVDGDHVIDAGLWHDATVAATGKEVLDLVRTETSREGNFRLLGAEVVELGAWQYGLEQTYTEDGAVWQVRSRGASHTGSAAVSTIAGEYLMGYAETSAFAGRLADLRLKPHLSGLWFSVHGGTFDTDGTNYTRGFDMDYGGVLFGYDNKIGSWGKGLLYTGVMFGYGRGNPEYATGRTGKILSKTAGLYGTYINESGFYADAVVQYKWLDSSFKTLDIQGNTVDGGKRSSGGVGASLAVGKKIELKNAKQWYLEPHAQIAYQRYGNGYFNTDSGMNIGTDGFDSLIGGVGLSIGYENEKNSFYVKATKMKEFDGDLSAAANGAEISDSFGGDWWSFGAGFTTKLNKRNKINIDVERNDGAWFKQEWSVRAGWQLEI